MASTLISFGVKTVVNNRDSARRGSLQCCGKVIALGRPNAPGKPEIQFQSDSEPNDVCLRWAPPDELGGTTLLGYQVECNRLGTSVWVRTSPPVVVRPELVLSGLETLHRYQFRVAAVNGVGISDYSELSDVFSLDLNPVIQESPVFLQKLDDITTLENDKTEFKVKFKGNPLPNVSWFKDGYEIFSSRRTVISTDEHSSTLIFHQTLFSDEGEIKSTATNRAGHAVTKARLHLESAPKLRYPRQYEDGLLYEINETVFIKSAIVGKPNPVIEWRHNGILLSPSNRIEISNTPKFSVLKIHSATRNDRGEYQIHAKNVIGEDTASFLVTITAPPDPPSRVIVTRAVDKSVTLTWDQPNDDGGCQIGNYLIEYFRVGWNVWLKATTSRQTSATLFGLIEGSEYRFRVKAESPFGISLPSAESASVRIPGRAVDMDCLAIEARVISDVLLREDGDPIFTPGSKNTYKQKSPLRDTSTYKPNPIQDEISGSNEMMIVLCPKVAKSDAKENRRSMQSEFEDWSPPPELSISTPNLNAMIPFPQFSLRCAVSSTELLHERAMARFYKFVAKEENSKKQENTYTLTNPKSIAKSELQNTAEFDPAKIPQSVGNNNYFIKTDTLSIEKVKTKSTRWLSSSFDDDYTGSTISLEDEYSDSDWDGRKTPLAGRKTPLNSEPPDSRPILEVAPKSILKDNRSIKKEKSQSKHADIRKSQPAQNQKTNNESVKTATKENNTSLNQFNKENKKLRKNNNNDSKPIISNSQNDVKKNESIEDEGKTVIDYYSNIVKEYGCSKKPQSQMYLKTEELKNAAEKQENESNKLNNVKHNGNKKILRRKPKLHRAEKASQEGNTILQKHTTIANDEEDKFNLRISITNAEKVVLIPIDYEEMEKKAKKNVKYLIDYTIDFCLLCLAFWVYFCKDERLAIPFTVLIIYRQLKETLFVDVPMWIKPKIPNWPSKKT